MEHADCGDSVKFQGGTAEIPLRQRRLKIGVSVLGSFHELFGSFEL